MLSVVGKFAGHVEAEIRDLDNDNLSQNLLNRNVEKKQRFKRKLRDVHNSFGRV